LKSKINIYKFIIYHYNCKYLLFFLFLLLLSKIKAGSVVLLYAVKYGDVPQIINVSGRFDLSTMPADRFTPAQNKLLKEKGEFIWMLYGKNGKKITTPEGIVTEEIKKNDVSLINFFFFFYFSKFL